MYENLYLIIFTILCVVINVYYATPSFVSITDENIYETNMNKQLQDPEVGKLVNADTINNLPNIDITTTNNEVNQAIRCRDTAIFLGTLPSTDYHMKCKTTCGGSGTVVHIKSSSEEYYYRGSKLDPGYWCVVNNVRCNTNTSYYVASVNSWICRSKYPDMFGGPGGDDIVACMGPDQMTSNGVLARLWDYSTDTPVHPRDTVLTNQDEMISSGRYRFGCKILVNNYIQHPLNRFRIVQNPCTIHLTTKLNKVNEKSKFVKYSLQNTGTDRYDWGCDCDTANSGLFNQQSGNKRTTCTECVTTYNKLTKALEFTYECLTGFSPFYKLDNIPLCNQDDFSLDDKGCGTSKTYLYNEKDDDINMLRLSGSAAAMGMSNEELNNTLRLNVIFYRQRE